MPPTGLVDGLDRVGIVVARLIVRGEDCGLRPFIVSISNNNTMCQGVTSRRVLISVAHVQRLSNRLLSRRLPGRPGAEALDLAITSFNHVLLPHSALLGNHDKPVDPKQNVLSCIHRAEVGSLSMSLVAIPALSVSAYIAAKYSLGRTVTSSSGTSAPLWSLRTQQISILRAFAQVAVMKAFAREAICSYRNIKLDHRVRVGIATCVKAFFVQQSQESLVELSEGCGAQGLFFHDQITSVQVGSLIYRSPTVSYCRTLCSSLCVECLLLKAICWRSAFVSSNILMCCTNGLRFHLFLRTRDGAVDWSIHSACPSLPFLPSRSSRSKHLQALSEAAL